MQAGSRFEVVRFCLFGAVALGALVSTGCIPISNQGYPIGAIYTGTQVPSAVDRAEMSGENKAGPKSGRACATGILGIAAFGDASIDAAKKAGGITSIHSVEYEATAVLGFLYVNACTVVHGA
jgi:hypothetical protein